VRERERERVYVEGRAAGRERVRKREREGGREGERERGVGGSQSYLSACHFKFKHMSPQL
jgi:hypothetical protein